jgi:hypothetical protein
MPGQPANPLTPELKQAFKDAIRACEDWTHQPDREPEVYVNPDRFTRYKITAICQFILACENELLPKEIFEALYIPDETRSELKRLFGGDETYHAGAYCLAEWVRHKRRRS